MRHHMEWYLMLVYPVVSRVSTRRSREVCSGKCGCWWSVLKPASDPLKCLTSRFTSISLPLNHYACVFIPISISNPESNTVDKVPMSLFRGIPLVRPVVLVLYTVPASA